MFGDLTSWLLSLVREFFKDLWEFFTDIAIGLLELLLLAVISVVGAIPAPSFLQGGLNSLFLGLDPAVIYFLNLFGLPQAFAMFGTAFVFRMARKVVTLFQW